MSVFLRPCLSCGQEISTDSNKKVGFHTRVSAGERTIACPGKGS